MKPRVAQGAQSRAPRPWGLTPVLEALHETHHGMCTELYVQLRLAGPENWPEMVVLPGTRLAFSLPACLQLTMLQEGLHLPSKALEEPSGFLLHPYWAGPWKLSWPWPAQASSACCPLPIKVLIEEEDFKAGEGLKDGLLFFFYIISISKAHSKTIRIIQ